MIEQTKNENGQPLLTDVGAIIARDDGRVFVQRRSSSRRLFPGAWDIVGGSVEDGESSIEALRREIKEETGWSLAVVLHAFPPREWSDGIQTHLEENYIVRASGDPDNPTLEGEKHDAYQWIGREELILLEDSAELTGSDFILRAVKDALAWLASDSEQPPGPYLDGRSVPADFRLGR